MAIQLKKSKLDYLIKHAKGGGDISGEIVADLLDLEPEDTDTIKAYIRKAQAALTPTATEAEESQPVVYQLRGTDGIIRDLELVKQKGNRIILEVPVVKDLVDIVIKGDVVTVDLEVLKGLDRNSLYNGVLVSTLLAAAELAKG